MILLETRKIIPMSYEILSRLKFLARLQPNKVC